MEVRGEVVGQRGCDGVSTAPTGGREIGTMAEYNLYLS
jgi:hypothetical protein